VSVCLAWLSPPLKDRTRSRAAVVDTNNAEVNIVGEQFGRQPTALTKSQGRNPGKRY